MNDAEKNKILRELWAVTTSGEVVGRVVPTPREHKGRRIDYVSLYVNGELRFVGELKYAKYFIETQDDEGILWTDEEPKTKKLPQHYESSPSN